MKRILLAIIILLFATPVWATTYYMRADGTAANKAAASGPCATQANTMSVATHNGETFVAGDIITLCDDGGDYSAQLNTVSSGSAGNVITYIAESGDTPTFDHGVDWPNVVADPGSRSGIYISGEDYITIDGLTFSNIQRNAILLGTGSTHTTIQNCSIDTAGGNGVYDDGGTATDLLVQYNEITRTGWRDKKAFCPSEPDGCWGGAISLKSDDQTAQYNYVHDHWGEGIIAQRRTGGATESNTLIQFNQVVNTRAPALHVAGKDDVTIRFNQVVCESGNTGCSTTRGQAGADCWQLYSHDGRYWGGGIGINTESSESPDGARIYGNFVAGCSFGINFGNTASPDVSSDDAQIYNNVFLGNRRNYDLVNADEYTNVVIRNNISYCLGVAVCDEISEGTTFSSSTISYNLFQVDPSANTLPWETNDVVGNPQISNPTGVANWQAITSRSDYTTANTMLGGNSDAIGNGVDLGGAATCADIDNLGTNCGLEMDASTNFHTLPTTATVAWQDHGDTSVDMGPWVYSADNPEQPSDSAGMGSTP